MTEDGLARIVERLKRSRRLLFITGAGISADSGVPTYRGIGGLYEGMPTEDGMPIEDALSGAMMQAAPATCWRYILQIEAACRGSKPNEGHAVIARLERLFDVWVLTQNVDGLHRQAGSTQVIDIHGDVRQLECTSCAWERTVEDFVGLACPPRCPECGAVVRPDVVLFGEALPIPKVARLQTELAAGFDAVISVGTSSLFPYISQPMALLRKQGALTVEVNPARTVVSEVAEQRVAMRATEALTALAHHLGV